MWLTWKIQHQSDWSIQSTCGVFTPMTLCFVCEHRWAQMIFLQFDTKQIWHECPTFSGSKGHPYGFFCSGGSHPSPHCPCVWLERRERHEVFFAVHVLSLESQQKLQRQNRCGISRVRVVYVEFWEKDVFFFFSSFNRYFLKWWGRVLEGSSRHIERLYRDGGFKFFFLGKLSNLKLANPVKMGDARAANW